LCGAALGAWPLGTALALGVLCSLPARYWTPGKNVFVGHKKKQFCFPPVDQEPYFLLTPTPTPRKLRVGADMRSIPAVSLCIAAACRHIGAWLSHWLVGPFAWPVPGPTRCIVLKPAANGEIRTSAFFF
jgi:hypothetical protein